jgi:aspartate kinase
MQCAAAARHRSDLVTNRRASSSPLGQPIVILKIGGSVLTDPPSYFTAASFVARRLDELRHGRVVAVVSAESGQTDALLRTAHEFVREPDAAALDLLWATGELRSVALLALALQAVGVNAAPANVNQTGVVRHESASRAAVHPLRLRALLAAHDVVVVPGFLARGDGDAIVSLGRGGSDLTAVLLAAALGAACELVKDVDGYYSSDPNLDPDARHLPALSFDRALSLADAGCRLVQRDAIAAARDAGLPLVVRSIAGRRVTRLAEDEADARTGGTPDRAHEDRPPALLLTRS